mmetsp:Transcript_51722/g.124832  ORF Transcript_51722/g.124832 Transcript_51722/m.124832 type:complete len:324 (+) Transcript_51722:129-1100(+)|eukprot:CAMPEP_0113456358 /NCGR_PEP_ID=MMETSP0014_2-20120614/8845_1 /TAXON_ID=2857 /ORGANISM="Nitzschia sp." /LENGTH=323 /DNA_ID=CAMNT_0000347807 /DNA_START=119 /DNA_END=1090 /DNA_ORIENTATION=+ /assembly_acc=CAM_ASM_000159
MMMRRNNKNTTIIGIAVAAAAAAAAAAFLLVVVNDTQPVWALTSSSSSNGRGRPSPSRIFNAATSTATPTTTITTSKVATVDLGFDRFVELLMPANSRQLSSSSSKSKSSRHNNRRGTKVQTDDGGGDVVWPAGFALARLIAHSPVLVEDRDVLELGCGLGLVSAAACKYGRPHHVALSDCNRDALGLAYASSTQLQRSRASVSRCQMTWNDPTTWPAQQYDTILASDVLYDKSNILPLVKVLQHYLCQGEARGGDGMNEKRAIIVDPINQINRDAFCFAAHKVGLFVETQEFPAPTTLGSSSSDYHDSGPELVLLNVSPYSG